MKSVLQVLALAIVFPITLSAQSEPWFFNSYEAIVEGIGMHDRESYDSAIAMFEKIHPGDTNYALAQYELSLSLSEAERHAEALKVARRGYKLNSPYNIDFAVAIGNSLDDLDRAEEAQAAYDSALATYPGSASLYYNRGIAHFRKERFEQGFADLKMAIEINPFHASSHFQLANYALNNGNYTQALLSLGYYFLSEPASGRTNAILQYFNSALSEKTDLEPIDFDFDPDKTYARSDKLIKSFAALRDAYKVDTDSDFPLMKQMHLAFSQSIKLKNKKDFWAQYYLPYYRALFEEDLFEVFSYLCSVNIDNEYYQNIVGKNLDDIKELIGWNSNFISDYHGDHILGYVADGPREIFYFHDGTDGLSARGNVDAEGNPSGEFTFFFAGGNISGKGDVDSKGNKTGRHLSYHPNGVLQAESIYKDGELNGPSKEYYDNGTLYVEAQFENGLLNGPAALYHKHGALSRKFIFKDGAPVDTIYDYHNNGQLSAKVPQQNGAGNGLATYFHEDGSLLSRVTIKDDKRLGPAEFYFPNGQLDTKANYNEEGLQDGEYESYHANGQLHEKGTMIEGIRVGNWQTFNSVGNKIIEVSFDERGKKTGTQIYFDHKGRKTELYQYKKEAIVYFEDYNRKGEIQLKGKAKRGKLTYKDLDGDGLVTSEGIFDETHRIGTWFEYDNYANKVREINYNDEGEFDGPYVDYFASGQLKSKYIYQNDSLHGAYYVYYEDGTLRDSGVFYKGERAGLARIFHSNGKMESELYYVNGETNGPRKYWDPEGNLERIEYYDMGTLVQLDTYYQGKLTASNDLHNPLDPVIAQFPNGKAMLHIQRTGRYLEGKGQWFFGNGQVELEGTYIDGNKEGKWSKYYPDGTVRSEEYYDLGRPIGTWATYHHNGQLAQTYFFEEGDIHGPNVYYNEEGIRTDSMNYTYGVLDNHRYFYSEAGELQHIRVYDLGKIIGWHKINADGSVGDFFPIVAGTCDVKAYFANGKLAIEYAMENGEFSSKPYRTYYSSGQLEREIQHKDGLEIGVTKSYYADGTLKSELPHEADVLNGTANYYRPDGSLERSIEFLAGMRHGSMKIYGEDGALLHDYTFIADDLYE